MAKYDEEGGLFRYTLDLCWKRVMEWNKRGKQTIKLARQISIYLLSSLFIAVVITGLFFAVVTHRTLDWLHEKRAGHASCRGGWADGTLFGKSPKCLAGYVLSTVTLAWGDADKGVDDDLHDFLGRLKVLGEKRPIALLDYAGNIIHAVGEPPHFAHQRVW